MAITFVLLIILELWSKIATAQKFRMDYMWAQAFQTFYRLHDIAMDWETAREICEAEGTELLVPNSLDELENLKLLLSNMKSHYNEVYVGIHSKFSVGNFVTMRGEMVSDTVLNLLWVPGSPDGTNCTQQCVVMTRNSRFDDRPCDSIYPFVCKILLQDVKFNEECDNFDMEYKMENNGKCYKFHEEPMSWHDAYRSCMVEEASLVIINSEDESKIITAILGDHINNNIPNPNVLLIGFSDILYPYEYRTIEGQTLEEAGYFKWSSINENTTEMHTKRCGAISRTGELLMINCYSPAMYLCQRKVNTKKQSEESD